MEVSVSRMRTEGGRNSGEHMTELSVSDTKKENREKVSYMTDHQSKL